jgi:hypothetical protein
MALMSQPLVRSGPFATIERYRGRLCEDPSNRGYALLSILPGAATVIIVLLG